MMDGYRWLGLLCMGFVVACSGGGGDDDDGGGGTGTPINSTPLAGKIAGQSWTMVSADTDAFLSDDAGFWATAYELSIPACSGQFSDGRELLLTIPKAPGDYPLSLNLNATFYDPDTGNNLVATKGHIAVDTISASQITGGAYIEYDAANTVNGRFTISICP